MVKILFLITRAEYGGAQSHLLELIEGYESSFEMHLATGEEGFLTTEARRLGATIHIVPYLVQPISPLKDVLAIGQIHSLIRRLQPILVHAHSSKAGVLGRVAARAAGVPAVFTAHGWGFAEGVPLRRKIVATVSERLASRFATKVITVSEADRALALRYRVAPLVRMTVIHNGARDTAAHAHPGADGVPRIVMVARFSTPKDHALLLKALVGQDGQFRLQFVGGGPDEARVQRLAKALGISERVSFLGPCNDVERVLAEASLFVLTSKWEGLPISILEAMRAGLPVIASNVGGIREAVIDGETGFLVDRGDLVELRSRLQQLLGDPELRTKMGAAGRKRYLEHFTAERMLDQTLKVYEEVLNEGTTSARQQGRH